MARSKLKVGGLTALIVIWSASVFAQDQKEATPKRAFIDGTGPGWITLLEKDFRDVNGVEDTWEFDGALIKGTGVPIGVMRTAKEYKNLEMVLEQLSLKYLSYELIIFSMTNNFQVLVSLLIKIFYQIFLLLLLTFNFYSTWLYFFMFWNNDFYNTIISLCLYIIAISCFW